MEFLDRLVLRHRQLQVLAYGFNAKLLNGSAPVDSRNFYGPLNLLRTSEAQFSVRLCYCLHVSSNTRRSVQQAFLESKLGKPLLKHFIEMPTQISKENINVKLPPGLHATVKGLAPARAGTLEKAYEEALRDWIAKGVPYKQGDENIPQTVGKFPIAFPSGVVQILHSHAATFSKAENIELLQMLATILVRGRVEEIEYVTSGLRFFSKYGSAEADPPSLTKRKSK